MSGPVRLGLIGAGGVVAGFHLPVLAALDSVNIDWIFDLDESRARELQKRFGIRSVPKRVEDADDVDVVLVATPVGARLQVLDVVAKRRWHAFCEKPFASTPEEHERMLASMESAGRLAGVGLVRRFYTSTKTARDLVRSEILGRVEAFLAGEGVRARKFGRGEWYHSDARAAGGGVFAETGTHLVDQVLAVSGAQRIELRKCRQERVNGLEMETRLTGSLTLSSGATVPLTMGVSRLNDVYNGIVVRCENGEIRLALDPEAGVELVDRTGHKIGTLPGAPKPGIYAAIRAEWLDFLELCRKPNATMPDTGLATTRFIAEAYARATVTARTTREQEVFQ